MLDTLFGNSTAAKVLMFLGDHSETYAQEVADSTETALSLVQAQLRRLEHGGVLVSHVKGRMRFYTFAPSFGLRDDLVSMLRHGEVLAQERDVLVRNALFTLGAPTFGEEVLVKDVERALVDGVELAHRDGTVASVLPVCFFKQRERVRVEKLVREAEARGEVRALGMFLELTAQLSGDARFTTWAERLRTKQKRRLLDYFFVGDRRSEFARAATKKNTPEVAKKWGFFANMGFDAFESMFRKHAHA